MATNGSQSQDLASGRQVVVLRGATGAGKTTVCLKLRDLARRAGLTVGGVITERGEHDDERVVMDVRAGQRRRFARRSEGDPSGLGWEFDPQGVAWGRQILSTCRRPADVLFVDELGPLELEQGRGWTNAFGVLAAGEYDLAIVCLRPGQEDAFHAALAQACHRRRLDAPDVMCLDVTPDNRDAMAETLLGLRGPASERPAMWE